MAARRFEGSAVVRQDGFIHFSPAEQAPETARRHFAGAKPLDNLLPDHGMLGQPVGRNAFQDETRDFGARTVAADTIGLDELGTARGRFQLGIGFRTWRESGDCLRRRCAGRSPHGGLRRLGLHGIGGRDRDTSDNAADHQESGGVGEKCRAAIRDIPTRTRAQTRPLPLPQRGRCRQPNSKLSPSWGNIGP